MALTMEKPPNERMIDQRFRSISSGQYTGLKPRVRPSALGRVKIPQSAAKLDRDKELV